MPHKTNKKFCVANGEQMDSEEDIAELHTYLCQHDLNLDEVVHYMIQTKKLPLNKLKSACVRISNEKGCNGHTSNMTEDYGHTIVDFSCDASKVRCNTCHITWSCAECSSLCRTQEEFHKRSAHYLTKSYMCEVCHHKLCVKVCGVCQSKSCYCGCICGCCC